MTHPNPTQAPIPTSMATYPAVKRDGSANSDLLHYTMVVDSHALVVQQLQELPHYTGHIIGGRLPPVASVATMLTPKH